MLSPVTAVIVPRLPENRGRAALSRGRRPSPSRPRWTVSATFAPSAAAARRLAGMTRLDPLTAGADAKRTEMLLRDARAVLHRLDTLASVAIAADDPAARLIADARGTVERLVIQLGRRGQVQQRQAREAVRRIRYPPR
jgi:hypothetical protein